MHEIIYHGTPLPLHFGMRAINEFTKLQRLGFEQAVSTTDALTSLDSIVTLTVSGLNEGARLAKSDRRYTEDEVWDMFDDEPELILRVSEIFIESVTPLTDKLGRLQLKNDLPTAIKSKNQ